MSEQATRDRAAELRGIQNAAKAAFHDRMALGYNRITALDVAIKQASLLSYELGKKAGR